MSFFWQGTYSQMKANERLWCHSTPCFSVPSWQNAFPNSEINLEQSKFWDFSVTEQQADIPAQMSLLPLSCQFDGFCGAVSQVCVVI